MSKIRIFHKSYLQSGTAFSLSNENKHYLLHVMRLKEGDNFYVFNGSGKEWIATFGISQCVVGSIIRSEALRSDDMKVMIAVSPIKWRNFHTMLRQLTEIGIDVIQPVFTVHTNGNYNFKYEKVYDVLVEATEQSNRLCVPEFKPYISFKDFINMYKDHTILACDCYSGEKNLEQIFDEVRAPIIFIGPEGGLTEDELSVPCIKKLNLSSNILRSETAAIVALSYYILNRRKHI
ncbi:16S rRNA (uracil(1498)-N(3))-methyltransferase [Anaplasmataceae bacterium AB001_6]|nr:16S rRNA (uracil(1498)-N(3))-methyltransferase [Anaplasmataceae bacterium AB001_6]